MKSWLSVGILSMALSSVGALIAATYIEAPSDAPPSASSDQTADSEVSFRSPEAEQAMAYARAVQNGDGEAAAAMVQWIVQRQQRLQLESHDPTVIAQEVNRLRQRAVARTLENNQLRVEGVRDAHVFAPGTRLAYIEEDEGPDDLDHPVAKRVWIRVTFPSPMRALLDMHGRPIRSLSAGVTISPDGFVVKAGILGNIQIDYASLSYDWLSSHGG